MTHKNRKKSRIFMFLSTGCSLLGAEGFSCSLGILYGGLGISKLQFLIKKIEIKFQAKFFFSPIFGHQTLDPDPVFRVRIPDPQHYFQTATMATIVLTTQLSSVAYPGGMHRMHVHPPSPPVHPPPAMCIPPLPSLKGWL
jgi:hypothetical protein